MFTIYWKTREAYELQIPAGMYKAGDLIDIGSHRGKKRKLAKVVKATTTAISVVPYRWYHAAVDWIVEHYHEAKFHLKGAHRIHVSRLFSVRPGRKQPKA